MNIPNVGLNRAEKATLMALAALAVSSTALFSCGDGSKAREEKINTEIVTNFANSIEHDVF